ncbi:MAG TPA: hypothetical protein VFG62_17085 [Rhodopila sp.]|nr:hypothetical protein [Rhodopila sp.]
MAHHPFDMGPSRVATLSATRATVPSRFRVSAHRAFSLSLPSLQVMDIDFESSKDFDIGNIFGEPLTSTDLFAQALQPSKAILYAAGCAISVLGPQSRPLPLNAKRWATILFNAVCTISDGVCGGSEHLNRDFFPTPCGLGRVKPIDGTRQPFRKELLCDVRRVDGRIFVIEPTRHVA